MKLERLYGVYGWRECIRGISMPSTSSNKPITSYCEFRRWVSFCYWMFSPLRKVFRWLEMKRNRWVYSFDRIRSNLSHHPRCVARCRSGKRYVHNQLVLVELFPLCLLNSIRCCMRSSSSNSFLNSKIGKRDYYWWIISIIILSISQRWIEWIISIFIIFWGDLWKR